VAHNATLTRDGSKRNTYAKGRLKQFSLNCLLKGICVCARAHACVYIHCGWWSGMRLEGGSAVDGGEKGKGWCYLCMYVFN
jgi:hypothetical protein